MVGRLGLALLGAVVLTGAALAANCDPQKRHNAADQAWAKAIRVQRSDLGPDWRVEHSSGGSGGAPKGCNDPDLSDLIETGSADQPDFSRNGSFVGSGSIVLESNRQMTVAWSRISRVMDIDCLTAAFKQGVQSEGVRLRIVSKGAVHIAKLAPHFKTGRFSFVMSAPPATIKGRFSFYLAARGRASVMLMVVSLGKPAATPISESLERRLATLVASRLER
jgi:hypothetical protein